MNSFERWLDRMVGFKPAAMTVVNRWTRRHKLGMRGSFIGSNGRVAWTPPRKDKTQDA